tara:strand:+ start:946 stop:1092 length:147 start_codon:yes stop_codon:yes gene_type:complete
MVDSNSPIMANEEEGEEEGVEDVEDNDAEFEEPVMSKKKVRSSLRLKN